MLELYLHSWRPDSVALCDVICADVSGRSVKLFVWSGITAERDKKWMLWAPIRTAFVVHLRLIIHVAIRQCQFQF